VKDAEEIFAMARQELQKDHAHQHSIVTLQSEPAELTIG
jgi:hypothetical protein